MGFPNAYFVILFILLALIIYLLINFIPFFKRNMSSRHLDEFGESINMPAITHAGDLEPYKTAVELASLGRFNEAVVSLHHATIRYLIFNRFLLEDLEYTNNEIKEKVRERNDLLMPFSRIAQQSELITFNHKNVESDICHKLIEQYRKHYSEYK